MIDGVDRENLLRLYRGMFPENFGTGMTNEAREVAWLALRGGDTAPALAMLWPEDSRVLFELGFDAGVDFGFDAGVAEGRRQLEVEE